MKLGLLTAILPDMDFKQVIDYCSDVGFQAVEAACWPREPVLRRYAGVTHLEFDEGRKDKLFSDLEYAGKKKVEISALAYYPNPLSPKEDERKKAARHIERLILAASETGIGQVNTFIFPDINAGNIGYKIEQRLGGFEAYGPIMLGLNAPINDLSRGCNASEVYSMAIVTAALA